MVDMLLEEMVLEDIAAEGVTCEEFWAARLPKTDSPVFVSE